MSDDLSSIDVDDPDVEPSGLRAVAKAGRKVLNETVPKLQRELVFAKAGIDVDDPRQAIFARGYDGELSKEAIRASATEFGIFQVAPDPNAQQNALILGGEQRVAAVAAGGQAQQQGAEAFMAGMTEAMNTGGAPALTEFLRQGGFLIAGDRE